MYSVDRVHLSVTHMLMLWTRFGFLDLFDYVPGEPLVDPREAFDTSEVWENLRFVSLRWLRRLKRTAARPKDQIDLAELEKIHGPPPSE
jgi:hypothetical protein